MNVRISEVVLLSVALSSLGFLVGCGQQDQTAGNQDAIVSKDENRQAEGVDPHDMPLTDAQKQQLREETAKYADAVARIKQLRDRVQEETKGGLPANPLAAHQALDQADLLVQWLPKIARDSGVPKDSWEAINTAASELREAFDKVHLNIDNKSDPDFASVEQQMSTRIAQLEAIAQ